MHRRHSASAFRRNPWSRRGSILTWFAVFLFAALPLMTLVVHLGIVTLTRRQMQTASNTAAIEGLRFRDEAPVSLTSSPPDDLIERCGPPPADSDSAEFVTWLNCARRWSASRQVTAVFDDDLTPDNGDPMQFGAGPIINIDGGVTLGDSDFRGLTTVSVPEEHAYKPRRADGSFGLEPNLGDERYGDMVAGQSLSADHREGPVLNGGEHLDDPYERVDIITSAHPDYDANQPNDAFLVRLRRTRSPDGTAPLLDDVPEISSTGPPIPFLFGRGGITRAVDDPDPAALWNRRERGTIVRATAIARAQPVVAVGVPSPADSLDEGLAQFDIQLSSWDDLLISPANVTFGMDGSFSNGVVGRLISREVLTLGDETTQLGSTLSDGDLELGEDRIVPIIDAIDGTDRVVGFGLIRLTGGGGTYTLERLPEAIVARNASSQFTKPITVTGADFDDVWDAFQGLSGRALAPALVRTVE